MRSELKQKRHKKLLDLLDADPLMSDRELAAVLNVSVGTIRIDRGVLNVPELRERARQMAENASSRLTSMKQEEVLGEIVELEPNRLALSVLLIGLAGRTGRQTLLFGLLCLLFIGYIAYPIVHTFAQGASWLYLLENLSFCAMLLVAMLLQRQIADDAGRLPRRLLRLAVLMCGVSVLLRLFAPLGGTGVIRAYSTSISLYEWAAAFYLTVSAIRALRRGTVQSRVLLCGGVVLDTALVMDRLLPMHEPIVTGWFVELASFALVLLIGAAVGLEVARQYLENTLLREEAAHMEQLNGMQQDAYALLQEQIDHTLTACHDLRQHLVAIGGMVESGQYERLAAYLEDYTARLPASEAVRYCDNGMINIIVQYYAYLAEMHSIRFRTRIVAPPSCL